MMYKWLKKYLSIVFVIVTFMGVFHHHKDFQTHENCQICTIQSNLANADTPPIVVYVQSLDIKSQSTISAIFTLNINKLFSTLNARAPPKNS